MNTPSAVFSLMRLCAERAVPRSCVLHRIVHKSIIKQKPVKAIILLRETCILAVSTNLYDIEDLHTWYMSSYKAEVNHYYTRPTVLYPIY